MLLIESLGKAAGKGDEVATVRRGVVGDDMRTGLSDGRRAQST
jgi:hypothetical protein